MRINFKNINYLKSGTKRQQLAYKEIKKYKFFEILCNYNPILTGTIPLGIDLPESDLDIICECKNHTEFTKYLIQNFSDFEGFKIYTEVQHQTKSVIAEFNTDTFKIEIFGQDMPTVKQHAYRHMLIENDILNEQGAEFRQKIIELKSNGIKTEPAFTHLLGLAGNPYLELLKLEKNENNRSTK